MNKIIKVSEGKIALYSMQDSNVYVDVVFHDETFWMTQKSIAELFEVDVSVASKHIKNIYLEDELNESGTIAKFAIVQIEGNREVARNPDFYSLDVIIAVGYRVNSKRATKFRQWATQALKQYIQKGYLLKSIFQKITQIKKLWKFTNNLELNKTRIISLLLIKI